MASIRRCNLTPLLWRHEGASLCLMHPFRITAGRGIEPQSRSGGHAAEESERRIASPFPLSRWLVDTGRTRQIFKAQTGRNSPPIACGVVLLLWGIRLYLFMHRVLAAIVPYIDGRKSQRSFADPKRNPFISFNSP
jgi:hypothetical protein